MMLDDFFTLTELNNGLTIPSRVKELVEVMQKESDSVVSNVAEATRQWSAVASAIAATENQDCLSLFIQSDGVRFMGKWLKDALKLASTSSDTSLEDSIIHLLHALGKLHVSYEKLVISEIWTTVKGLLVHNSSSVREKAQMLCETWESWKISPPDVVEGSTDPTVQETGDTIEASGHYASCELASVPSDKGECDESARDEQMPTSSEAAVPNEVEDFDSVHCSSGGAEGPSVHDRSPLLVKHTEELRPCSIPTDVIDSCEAATSTQENAESNIEMKPTVTPEISSTVGKGLELSPFHLGLASSEQRTSVTESSSQKPHFDEEKAREYVKKEASKDRKKSKRLGARGITDHMANNFSMKTETSKEPGLSDKARDIYVYGIVDPLELARQVAIEVQREVIDSGDQSCSSSDKLPEGISMQPHSPSSVSGRQSKSSQSSLKDEACDTDMSDETSPIPEESASSVENPDTEQAIEAAEMDNSLLSEVSEAANTGKPFCSFDLNQELLSEGTDGLQNQVLTPISIVSASKAAASPGLALQFEGNLGWRGSAATSAFRPALPRRMPDSDLEHSAGTGSSSSKMREGGLDIDLNAAEFTEGGLDIDLNAAEFTDAKLTGLLPDKKFPILTGLSSVECSLETTQTRPDRLQLDLNCFSEDRINPSDLHLGQIHQGKNGYGQSTKHQSSSKSIDLNDKPSFLSDMPHLSCSSMAPQTLNPVRPDDSVISIMGARVKVNSKDALPQNLSFPKGQISELAYDGRSGGFMGIGSVLPYSHSPGYSYQNMASAAVPFPPAVYGSGGPFPYMVDSRGAPVIPQFIPPATALPSGFSQTPFFINMANMGPSNGIPAVAPPPRGSFDHHGGSRAGAPSGFTQFLNLGPAEDSLRSSFNPFAGGKRKEPENGWEHYPFHHQTPPRK